MRAHRVVVGVGGGFGGLDATGGLRAVVLRPVAGPATALVPAGRPRLARGRCFSPAERG
jgi:hypothetical protein